MHSFAFVWSFRLVLYCVPATQHQLPYIFTRDANGELYRATSYEVTSISNVRLVRVHHLRLKLYGVTDRERNVRMFPTRVTYACNLVHRNYLSASLARPSPFFARVRRSRTNEIFDNGFARYPLVSAR